MGLILTLLGERVTCREGHPAQVKHPSSSWVIHQNTLHIFSKCWSTSSVVCAKMWPSVPSFNPFADIACPAGAQCDITCCIFTHADHQNEEREPKRRKLEDASIAPGKRAEASPTLKAQSGSEKSNVSLKTFSSAQRDATGKGVTAPNTPTSKPKAIPDLPRSATRPISPPQQSKAEKKPEVPVPLTPRKLVKEPALFTKRLALLKLLRTAMAALNDKVASDKNADIKSLKLTDNRLNKLAVDEEEKIGRENKAVYENVIKHRIMALKKMNLDNWIKEMRARKEKEDGVKPAPEPPELVETGLTPTQEVLMLHKMTTSLDGLDPYGYITRIPSDEAVEESRQAQISADHWEKCDRCSTRFQVFQDRREEDGAFTSGGECKHHWGKRNPQGKKAQGQLPDVTLSCCNQPVGSPPCSTSPTHVFKVKSTDVNRLASIMPFVRTPENERVEFHTAVCFDCEMGYTTLGLELLRLTAVSWPSHKPILDILVRPLGHILDVNTRFSGVTQEQFVAAKPYDAQNPSVDPKDLRIVDSPHTARELFLSLISPETPLIGHALENDLTALRLIHPTIVDTVCLYPHPRGLPLRLGLRHLARQHLHMDIQQAGAAGHDSYEDAKTTGELVRHKLALKWKGLRIDGWTFKNDELLPPLPNERLPVPKRKLEDATESEGDAEARGSEGPQTKKPKEG